VSPTRALSAVLENCTVATSPPRIDKPAAGNTCDQVSDLITRGYHRMELAKLHPDHRQDSKGTRWMPRHLESMKGVDDCDKPRLGVEQPLTRGFPNG
jgi:hypothetical protein